MISISGVMFLFGLTWLFAILTFSVTGFRETFQILFTVFNSLQGLFIFIFFCIFNKEALESWKELLSCGKYRSALLHPSQAKYSSSAATKKTKQIYTRSTGITASSGGKYSSELSKSDYNSSTITKSNIYEKSPLEHKEDLGTDAATKDTPEKGQSSLEHKEDLGTDTATKETPEKGQSSTDAPDSSLPTGPVITVNVELADSNDGDNNKQQDESAAITTTKKEGMMRKKIASLKARIKRYSTRKVSKHHVEEVEVDFDSDNSHDSNEENVSATQF